MLEPSATNGQSQTHAGWTWMRVYYFEPSKDDLILDGIWPAVNAARNKVGGSAYFQRDWVGGPNVLVGVYNSDVPSVMRGISSYIAEHPSTTILTEEMYSSQSRRLSTIERISAEALCANNSVVIASEPVAHLIRQEYLKEAVRRYLGESSSLCMDWLHSIRAGTLDRNQLSLHLMAALIWIVNPERLTPYLSLRSHAEGYLRRTDAQGPAIRKKFRAQYDGEAGPAIRSLLEKTLDSLRSGREIVPNMHRYVALMQRTLVDFYNGVLRKEYELQPLWKSGVDESPAFRSWQMTISLLYRTLNQLGLAPASRFLGCYLVSRAIEDSWGHKTDLQWDWEQGPINLSIAKREDVERALPFFLSSEACL